MPRVPVQAEFFKKLHKEAGRQPTTATADNHCKLVAQLFNQYMDNPDLKAAISLLSANRRLSYQVAAPYSLPNGHHTHSIDRVEVFSDPGVLSVWSHADDVQMRQEVGVDASWIEQHAWKLSGTDADAWDASVLIGTHQGVMFNTADALFIVDAHRRFHAREANFPMKDGSRMFPRQNEADVVICGVTAWNGSSHRPATVKDMVQHTYVARLTLADAEDDEVVLVIENIAATELVEDLRAERIIGFKVSDHSYDFSPLADHTDIVLCIEG